MRSGNSWPSGAPGVAGGSVPARSRNRRGIAMVAVLLVLMALFVLCAPFLLTVGNADRASAESAERANLRIALDSAARHARSRLGASHPGLDPTPYFDDQAELQVTNRFPADFLAPRDPTGVMWDLDVEDVAGRVDLNSASPHVLANLMGGVARLTNVVGKESESFEVNSTEGFLPEGALWLEGELVAYAELGPSKFSRLTRGLLVKTTPEGAPCGCGPQPAGAHALGAHVVDQRAWAIAEKRIARGEFQAFDRIESVREAAELAIAGDLGREAFLALERTASAHGGVRAGLRWQRAVRVTGQIGGDPPYGCQIPIDEGRWFNPGTTVRITDGKNTEYGLVRAAGGDSITLTEPLEHEYEPYRAVVQALARSPVNVNTASSEVLRALFLNLKLRSKSARITASEADQLVGLVLESRPFTGFEDFLRRIVLPAGGLEELPDDAPVKPDALAKLARQAQVGQDGKKTLLGFLDPDDAIALYKNALNANDNELEFATMPLSFTSRDVYGLELRAAVNAPSGIERASGTRERVELVIPQRDLMQVWTRQEDFDLAPRLDLAAAGWLTGPNPTSRFDPLYGETASRRWPTRARAHLGPHDTSPSGEGAVFASREEQGWIQLAPQRENDGARRASYALHFDEETRALEGRYLPDEPVSLTPATAGWEGPAGLLKPLSFSLWIQPRELEEGALLLDLGGSFTDSDRLSLLLEQGDLVLRVLDGAGDHPVSSFHERAEIHYPLAGEGPGLPLDTWTHVHISVDGTRPDQMTLLVDGRRSARTPGLTRLTSAITEVTDTIPVESTEGFPDRGVLRIGEELIEYTKDGPKTFRARFVTTGEAAGFGGRLAREQFSGAEPNEVPLGFYKQRNHPAGTSVELYGYSAKLFSNAPNASSGLPTALGAFGVARVVGIVKDGSEKMERAMEDISGALRSGAPFPLGDGLDSQGNDVEALVLEAADPNTNISEVMQCFNPNGGYAALLAPRWRVSVTEIPGGTTEISTDQYGIRLGGVEVIRYSGWEGTHLRIDQRGDQVALRNLRDTDKDYPVTGRAAFIFFHEDFWAGNNERLSAQVKVVPISLPITGTGGIAGFLPATAGDSEFAQITRLAGESDLTEWVRYDEITGDGQLVRDDPNALNLARFAAVAGIILIDERATVGGPGSGGGKGRSGALEVVPAARTVLAPPTPVPRRDSNYWDYVIGQREDEQLLVTRSVRSAFQFRGVLGTHSHAHPAGTNVLPVFKVQDLDETAGQPGRFDHVMFLSAEPTEPGFPGIVQHAHRPYQYTYYSWQNGEPLAPVEGVAPVALDQERFDLGLTYVALQGALAVPFPSSPGGNAQNPIDSRLLSRMVLFPSGELPRVVQKVAIGSDARSGGSVPSAVVDEALCFQTSFGGIGEESGQLVLAQPMGEGDQQLVARVKILRTTHGDWNPDPLDPIQQLPAHGGLLRIGDEILCYDAYDADGYVFTIPPGGRGLLGTDPQNHQASEGITPLLALPAGVLAANIGPDDADLPLLEIPAGFPPSGTVLLERELVHYARADGPVLSMPRGSSEPGMMDRKGPGLFRARYGTERTGHGAGTPAILFPFRYWDRWSERADAPELAWFEISCDQPDAFWKRAFFKVANPAFPGPELGVLQRTDEAEPWDADPGESLALEFLWKGKLENEGNAIGVQSDRLEWRIFVRHQPGSFDPDQGLAHGWKTTPKLELFGVEYMGPGRTLERQDR